MRPAHRSSRAVRPHAPRSACTETREQLALKTEELRIVKDDRDQLHLQVLKLQDAVPSSTMLRESSQRNE